MKLIRVFISTVLIITMIFSISIQAFALSNSYTTAEKAEYLESLILKDATDSYNLNDSLKRSDSAVITVRLMGEEMHVLLNADEYKNTMYADVYSTDWQAPYIGYCRYKSIITSSSNFNPDVAISEKGFLIMMLCALEYKPNIDFTWNTIYSKAYEVGLVTGISYIVKTDDNYNFTLKDAVDIIFRAVSLKAKESNKELIYNLIDNGLITRNDAVEAGIIEDATPTEVKEIYSVGLDKVKVVFNEDINSISDADIYLKDNLNDTLACSIDTIIDDTVTIKTGAQKDGVDYILEIKSIIDKEGNTIDKLSTEFSGYNINEVDSDFFRIRSIEPINSTTIKVYFTQPVNINSEIGLYYRIRQDSDIISDGMLGNINVSTLSNDEYGVILSINRGVLVEDEIYTLDISGDMVSAYGVNLNSGTQDSMMFVAEQNEVEAFKLVELFAYDNQTILLNFNKDINPFLAEQIFNFYVVDEDDDPIRITKSQVDANGHSILLSIDETIKNDDTYYVTINNLNDITKKEYIIETRYSFEADYGTTDRLEVDEIEVIDRQTIMVYFNRPLNEETASKREYYIIYKSNGSSFYPEKVMYDVKEDPYAVKLYLSKSTKLYNNYDYDLKVNSAMKDSLGNNIKYTKYSFDGTSEEKSKPNVSVISVISTDSVRLIFSQEIAFNEVNLSPSNYNLQYVYNGLTINKMPIAIIYVDKETIVLRFDKLESDTDYILKFDEIIDFMGESSKVTDEGSNFIEFSF